MCAMALAAVLYNGGLSIINAHVMPMAFAHVAVTEIAVLAAALLYVLNRGIYREDIIVVIFVIFNLLIASYVSVINKTVFVDFFRNTLIICCFGLLGTYANKQTIIITFRVACLLVLGVLIVETWWTKIFEDLFEPANYFRNTRGLEQISFGGSKLFQNSIKIPGRFSFNIADHRTSSLFVEQVSLANFSGVLLVFLISMFKETRIFDRVLFMFTIALILVTNDSRTMLMFASMCYVGYFVFPRLDKSLSLLIMPLVVIAGFLVYIVSPEAVGDDLDGRVVLTVKKIIELDFPAILGLGIPSIAELMDSGYVYVVVASTIFGFTALWLFVCFFPVGRTPAQRRCAYSLSIFFFMNMMIGGTAVFSIKIAGLLWLLVGYMNVSDGGRPPQIRR
ncbi:hypothetical protein JJB09_15920 [Rhizobium sp. KVB221]|uniref:Polymerase n=1 Tax=Rhizobium setariae TaxID=2801340 RepID=A0A936YRR2_9HYPH|nr:hypothetical protein [Rhizobium setariae]